MELSSNRKEVFLDEIAPEIHMRLDDLAEKGNQFEKQGQYENAVHTWLEALELIPEPQRLYSETIWFLAAVGDVYFQKAMYEEAQECFDKARKT